MCSHCIGRQSLKHWTPGEVPSWGVLNCKGGEQTVALSGLTKLLPSCEPYLWSANALTASFQFIVLNIIIIPIRTEAFQEPAPSFKISAPIIWICLSITCTDSPPYHGKWDIQGPYKSKLVTRFYHHLPRRSSKDNQTSYFAPIQSN